eukprot:9515-Heterococcus_DN1.PRE.1
MVSSYTTTELTHCDARIILITFCGPLPVDSFCEVIVKSLGATPDTTAVIRYAAHNCFYT